MRSSRKCLPVNHVQINNCQRLAVVILLLIAQSLTHLHLTSHDLFKHTIKSGHNSEVHPKKVPLALFVEKLRGPTAEVLCEDFLRRVNDAHELVFVKEMLDATLVNAHLNLMEDKSVIVTGFKYTQHHILLNKTCSFVLLLWRVDGGAWVCGGLKD